jgi:rRNA maturation RNase YbeY
LAIIFHEKDIYRQKIIRSKIKKWIAGEILRRKKVIGDINIIFTNDEFLREINKKYLKRNYLTDIISFDYSEKLIINGDIFISIERVKENAVEYNVCYDLELYRVIIHGILHLLGYKDDTDDRVTMMRKQEDLSIKRLDDLF